MNMNCCRLLFHSDCVGEISSVLVLFPDVHRLAAPRACSLNESHRVARCLINLRRWTPVSALQWICGPHDGESCCNMKPGSRRSHISLLQWRLRRPQPGCDLGLFSSVCSEQLLTAAVSVLLLNVIVFAGRPSLCICVQVCVCVNYCYHPGDSGGRRVRHLEENTHGGYLDEPPDRASTWNSAACYYGNRKSGW